MYKRNAHDRRIRCGVLIPLAAAASIVLSGCGGAAEEPQSSGTGGDEAPVETIKIAAPMPLTGPAASYGESFIGGAQIAVDQINEAGGIESLGGAQLELLVEDDGGDPARGAELLRSMIDEGAIAAVGPIPSASVLVSLVVLDELQVPMISPSLDTQLTEQGSEFFFRVVQPAAVWAEQGVDFLSDQIDDGEVSIDKVGILTFNVPPGTGVKAGFESAFEDLGIETESIEFAAADTRDFAPIISQFESSGVDLVVGTLGPGEAARFADSLELQTWRPDNGFLWVAGGASVNAGIEAIGPTLKNNMVVNYTGTDPVNPAGQIVAEELRSETGKGLDSLSGSAPAIIGAIAAALEQSGATDGVSIRDALRTLDYPSGENWNTLAGGVKFDEVGNNADWQAVITQHDGAGNQATVYPADAADAQPIWPAHD